MNCHRAVDVDTFQEFDVLDPRSVLLEFALSRMLSRGRRMQCRVGYYILGTSPSMGLRRGFGLSLYICF